MKKLLFAISAILIALSANAQSCPDDNHPHMLDLGLPSGTKWACCNVGADKPEAYGGYYAWGETEEKEFYGWSTYIHCDGSEETCHDLGSDIAGTQYDVAHVLWGDSWVMPSDEQYEELNYYCSFIWTTKNGVNGALLTGPNGGTIFFPAAGFHWFEALHDADNQCSFWSSTKAMKSYSFCACGMDFIQGGKGRMEAPRNIGHSVRPVISETNNNAQKCPDDNHPHMIDLGLPSGTKWACCNVGADKPEAYGGHYAWGETEEKDKYSEVTYKYCTGEDPNSYGWYQGSSQYQDLGDDIAGTQYDVAHVLWGDSWVMPSLDEIKELFNNCDNIFTSLNGVEGLKFTSKNNGGSIFLPAADLYSPGIGQYWSSTQEPTNSKWAYGLYFFSYDLNWCTYTHPLGLTVRPVISVTNRIHLPKSSSDISSHAIYNIYGIKVADTIDDINTLSPGIYIVNGKKMVIK